LHNESDRANHWLTVKLRGRRSNADGIGARIHAQVGAVRWVQEIHGGAGYLSQSDPRAPFGLRTTTTIPSLEVRWPSGTIDRLTDVRADQFLTVEEGRGAVRP